MATSVGVALKRRTVLQAAWPPAIADYEDALYLSWVEPGTETVRVALTTDLARFDEPFEFGVRSRVATALAADRSGLLLGWVDPDSGELLLVRSVDGVEWSRQIRTGIRLAGSPGLAVFDERIWLARSSPRRGGFDVLSSSDGADWQVEHSVKSSGTSAPLLFVFERQIRVAWVDGAAGSLQAVPVGAVEGTAPSVLHSGPIAFPSLLVRDGALHLAFSDDNTDEIHLLKHTRSGWSESAVLHERVDGAPALFGFGGDVGVAWVRDDGSRTIHLRTAGSEAIIEPSHVFSGDLQGHPTALSSDHQTPYPYLGIVVLPNDWSLPKGHSAATLTAGLDAALDESADFWKEASFGAVEITHDVHPSVVTLPSPMSTYFVRARPKLIEGYGASYPIAFSGSKTLDLTAAGNFSVTVTFANNSLSLNDVIDAINNAVGAANYNGPADSKPVATKSDIGQLRIRTAGLVDPGDALAVTGGSALNLLGLDAANRTVLEGNTKQTDHLKVMLRDALKAVAQTKPNPAAFLNKYYGCCICIASNVGWYVVRANATLGPEDVSVLPNEKDFKLASYYITSLDADDVHAHEIGHNLKLPDEYEEGARNVGAEPGTWDVMDGNRFSHPTAWTKAYRSAAATPASRWLDANHITTLDSAKQSVEVLLAPLESEFPTTNPFAQSHPGVPLTHAVKVPIAVGHAYYVENRQRGHYNDTQFGEVQYSTQLPGNGIIITDAVDDVAALSISRVPVVLVHPQGLAVADVPHSAIDQIMAAGTVAAKQAIIDAYVPAQIPQSVADKIAKSTKRDEIEWILRSYRDSQIRAFYPVDTLGEDVLVHQFPNGDGEIRVKLLEIVGTARPYVYRVRVSWGRQGSWFDLEIRKWQSPPPYETADIWIDSEENGWDTYQHSDATANPNVAGNPVLNGDRPWVGRNNRVMARVWNRGDVAQNNVRVDFREVVPPGQSSGYIFDTDFIDIPAGGSAIATGIWRPKKVPANEHGCVSAQVEYRKWDVAANVIGEMNANNNTAQENIGDFYVAKSSPYSRVDLPFEFASPLPETCEMKLRAHGLQPGWTLRVEPYRFYLRPGESMQGRLVLEAATSVPLEDPEEGPAAPIISLEALTRIGCTWEPIGGFSMIAHTVRRSTLDVTVDPAGDGANVTVSARDTAGPIARANVALGLILDDDQTLSVTRVETDTAGQANGFVPIDWNRFGRSASLSLDARLSPKGQSGPAATTVSLSRP